MQSRIELREKLKWIQWGLRFYDLEFQRKGSDTIVLVQYDRNSKARAVKYALLDSFIMKKMDVRLR